MARTTYLLPLLSLPPSIFLANVSASLYPSKMDGAWALVTSYLLPHSCPSTSACAVLFLFAIISVSALFKDWASRSARCITSVWVYAFLNYRPTTLESSVLCNGYCDPQGMLT